MRSNVSIAFEAELVSARAAEVAGQPKQAWRHLERAHILSQPWAWPHVKVHWRMLGFGMRQRDLREVRGQVLRMLVAAPGSWLGRAPLGNTGGSDVGILTPMQIPSDLRLILDDKS